MKEAQDKSEQVGKHDAEGGPDHDLHEHRGGAEDIPLKEEEHSSKGSEGQHDGLKGNTAGLGLVHGGDATNEEPLAEGVDRCGDRRPGLLEDGNQG